MSLLQRLFSKFFGAAPVPAPALRAAAQPLPKAAPVPQPVAGNTSVIHLIGPRRPLIAADGSIAGFEFCIHADMQARLAQRGDQRGRLSQVAAVLTSARLTAQTGRIGLARLPLDWLVHASGVEVVPGVWLGIEAAAAADSSIVPVAVQVMDKLRAQGAKLGWEAGLLPDVKPDFVLVKQGAQPMSQLLQSQRHSPEALKALPALLTDVSCLEDMEKALAEGIDYACGALAPTGAVSDAREFLPVPPEVHRVGLLLNQLVQGAETAAIVGGIKSDVGLSFRLLKRLNSARFAQIKAAASIDQAVLLLGRNELYRWLSLLMVQFAGRRRAASALQEITLWRSRLLELLALQVKEPAPGQLFTLGLASMLGTILHISQQDVVSTLNLPPLAAQALLQQSGPWYDYLLLAQQLEQHRLDESSPLVARFGGAARVFELEDDAWAWAWAAEHGNAGGVSQS